MSDERPIESWAGRRPYVAGAVMIAAVTAFGFAAAPVLHPANIDVVYLLAILVSALTGGRRPAIFTATVSAVIFDYCFIPPYFSFHVSDLPYIITLLVFVIVAVATSALAARARRLAREEAARARAEAVSQAKDDILNKISHELRSPLNAVLGWTQLIESASADRERLARGVSGLQRSAELLARLVDDLLNASRITSGKLSVRLAPTAVSPIISRVVESVAPSADSQGVVLQSSIDPVGNVLGDEQRIEQVARNLISNALKFTPAGGRVSVRLTRADDLVELVVADTGRGIVAEFLPQIFDQFSQASSDDARRGLGLGLAIVKHLVKEHGGTVDVHSAGPGQGATFTVRIPAIPVKTVRSDEPKSEASVLHT